MLSLGLFSLFLYCIVFLAIYRQMEWEKNKMYKTVVPTGFVDILHLEIP